MIDRVVVTGAQGFLGRHIVAAFLDSGGEVLGLGRSQPIQSHYTHSLGWLGRRVAAPLPPYLVHASGNRRYRYESVDTCDSDAMLAALEGFRPDTVVHAAAALRDEEWTSLFASNVQAVIGLVDALARHRGRAGRAGLLLVSSGSVYGRTGDDSLPLRETEPCHPIDLYAISKRTGEDVARVLATAQGIPLAVTRVFNLIGPGLQDRHLAASLAGQIAAIRLGLRERRISVGPLTASRDFIDVRDAAAAVALVAGLGAGGATYNVASGEESRAQRILDALLEMCGMHGNLTIERLAARSSDMTRSVADIGQLASLGYEPKVRLLESLRDMLNYYEVEIARSTSGAA